MKIQAFVSASETVSKNNRKEVNFNGYNESISKIMIAPIKNLKNAEDVFEKLINEIEKDNTITKTNFFATINNMFKRDGLRGMLENLKKKPHNDSYTECMLEYTRNNHVVNLAKEKKDVLDIVSYSGDSKDMRLGFLSDAHKGGIEFYTDNEGDVFVERTCNEDFLSRGFYSDTGSKKIEIRSYFGGLWGGSQDKTFFNKDGSKPFFKNLFLGW